MPHHSALCCVSRNWQNNAKPLISNGLRFVVTCLLTAALWVLFHLRRHTFATTIALAHGVPIESLAQMMGHRDIKTTQVYARVLAQTVVNDGAELAGKIE